jgi:ethanolamine utilization protein EutA
LIENGRITATGCLNVGGRQLKFDKSGVLTYISPVLQKCCMLKVGEKPSREQVESVAKTLVSALEMAAGLRDVTPLLAQLTTEEAVAAVPIPKNPPVISFSGGVADCIETEHEPLIFGDMGPVLGREIRNSRLCQGEYVLGNETIRATVIGAGCHSAQLSGSTVFHQNIRFPLKNTPVVHIRDISSIDRERKKQEGAVILSIPGMVSPSYRQITAMAEEILAQAAGNLLICLEQDMAKALGQALAARVPPGTPILCIDRVKVREGSYLDIGAPVGHALPVVVKTLILPK